MRAPVFEARLLNRILAIMPYEGSDDLLNLHASLGFLFGNVIFLTPGFGFRPFLSLSLGTLDLDLTLRGIVSWFLLFKILSVIDSNMFSIFAMTAPAWFEGPPASKVSRAGPSFRVCPGLSSVSAVVSRVSLLCNVGSKFNPPKESNVVSSKRSENISRSIGLNLDGALSFKG